MKKILIIGIICATIAVIVGASQTPNPYLIYIDCQEAILYLLKDGKMEKSYPCAPGKKSTPSPIGNWKIVNKDRWGEGFGGRWLGLNCPWGKFGIHGTIYPNSVGRSSSHGCIRMFSDDVKELYDIVPYGTKVIIVNGPYGDFGVGFRNLEPGMYGSDVMRIQVKLKEEGMYEGGIDGKYGEGMKSAVHAYQKKYNMFITNTISAKMQESMGFILME